MCPSPAPIVVAPKSRRGLIWRAAQTRCTWRFASVNKNEILIGLSESEKTKFGKQDFALQSLTQKVFSAIWAVESEVNNGGFSQYFSNDSAESASFVVQALETIGAPKTA